MSVSERYHRAPSATRHHTGGPVSVQVDDGGSVMVPVFEVLCEVPAVTVTVAVAMLIVDTTAVVAQEVMVDAGHCELVGDKVSESVAVPLVAVEVEGLGPGEDDGELVIVDMPDWGKPHSSRL